MTIEIKSSRTKSGKTVQVAHIPAAMVDHSGPERMHWLATEIAHQNGCAYYHVFGPTGARVAAGKAGALPTQEQTARTHGDGSDWSRD